MPQSTFELFCRVLGSEALWPGKPITSLVPWQLGLLASVQPCPSFPFIFWTKARKTTTKKNKDYFIPTETPKFMERRAKCPKMPEQTGKSSQGKKKQGIPPPKKERKDRECVSTAHLAIVCTSAQSDDLAWLPGTDARQRQGTSASSGQAISLQEAKVLFPDFLSLGFPLSCLTKEKSFVCQVVHVCSWASWVRRGAKSFVFRWFSEALPTIVTKI